MSDKTKKIFAASAIAVLIVFFAFVAYFIGKPMIQSVSEPETFRAWVSSHGVWGKIAFIGMVVLQIVVAFIPGEPLELGAGYAFGAIEGFFLCMIGIVIGSALVFGFVRKFGVKLVEVFFPLEKIRSLKFLQNERRFHEITFLVFLIPGTPKDLLCYVSPLTPIRFWAFLLISSIARIPSVISSTIAGGALGDQSYLTAGITFGVTLVISLIGMKIYDVIVKKKQGEKSPDSKEETDAANEKSDKDL